MVDLENLSDFLLGLQVSELSCFPQWRVFWKWQRMPTYLFSCGSYVESLRCDEKIEPGCVSQGSLHFQCNMLINTKMALTLTTGAFKTQVHIYLLSQVFTRLRHK